MEKPAAQKGLSDEITYGVAIKTATLHADCCTLSLISVHVLEAAAY